MLDVASNSITDDGFIALFCSLKESAKSGHLRNLNISQNWIERSIAVNALVELLGQSKALQSLNISELNIEKKLY